MTEQKPARLVADRIIDALLERYVAVIPMAERERLAGEIEAGEMERMLDFAAWCEQQRYLLGAVDGYDYRSGEEHGLCRAQIEAANRAAAIRGNRND